MLCLSSIWLYFWFKSGGFYWYKLSLYKRNLARIGNYGHLVPGCFSICFSFLNIWILKRFGYYLLLKNKETSLFGVGFLFSLCIIFSNLPGYKICNKNCELKLTLSCNICCSLMTHLINYLVLYASSIEMSFVY